MIGKNRCSSSVRVTRPAWVLTFVALWPAPGYAEAVMVLGALASVFAAGWRFLGIERADPEEALASARAR